MKKSNVMKFPQKPLAEDEQNALWMFAAASGLKDHYSFEYNSEKQHWVIKVGSSTLEGVAALISQCRHILGWDREETVNVAEN